MQAVLLFLSATVISSGGCRRLYQAWTTTWAAQYSAEAEMPATACINMYWAAVTEGTQYHLTTTAVHTSHRYDSTHPHPTKQTHTMHSSILNMV